MQGTAQELWDKLHSRRRETLERARECARLTIPGLLPPEGHDETNPLPTPYQGLGARGVNNLASKLLMVLLPPNQTFFKLEPDEQVLQELKDRNPDALSEAKKRLSNIEQSVLSEIEGGNYRPAMFEGIRHLVATGDVLIHQPAEGGVRVFPISQYVTRRDRAGNAMDIIVHEQVGPEMLDEETIEACKVDTNTTHGEKTVDIYTHIRRKDDRWKINQEINGVGVPGSAGHDPLEKPSWLALRWTAVPGEDYGRGLVEEHLGDMRSLDGISKAILRFAANASKIVWLINPNGLTNHKKLAKAESGEFVSGREEDVSLLSMDKFADFRVVQDTSEAITRRLHQAFLLNASIQRDAERVTAAEIQMMAQELEDALGGVYSVLSQEFQVPFLSRVMARLQKKGKIPELPQDVVKTTVTTGLQALGRGHDLQKLRSSLQLLQETVPPEVLAQKVNWDDVITRVFAAQGVDTSGLIVPEEQQRQQAQQRQTAEMIQEAGPGVAQELAKQTAQGDQQNG